MLRVKELRKITALQEQINAIYASAKERMYGGTCHMCGAGDLHTKTGTFKVRRVVNGYEHRPHESPHLCHKHACSWARTHNAFNPLGKRSNQEIDLHFAGFLAQQLLKESKNEHRSASHRTQTLLP